MEMFTSFKKVMADPEITTAGKSVFLNLLSRMDKKGYCYPAVNTMEKQNKKRWENNLQIDII